MDIISVSTLRVSVPGVMTLDLAISTGEEEASSYSTSKNTSKNESAFVVEAKISSSIIAAIFSIGLSMENSSCKDLHANTSVVALSRNALR